MTQQDLAAARAGAASARWEDLKQRGSGWLEWRLDAPDAWSKLRTNPFDPALADIWVDFVGPNGQRLRATAFWTRDSRGTGWAVRLLPPATGRWSATSAARLGGSEAVPVGRAFNFDVAQVPARQRVIVDPKYPSHFAYEDGSPYVPIGLNIAWANGSSVIDDYRRWFKRLADNGGNFARVWMASWAFGLEWSDTGLGNYTGRLDRAALLDQVLELAEASGIRVMLCMLNHGAFSDQTDAEWANNPYNASKGGPLQEPGQFMTNPVAKELFARRVRYTAARWAHSPALHSWEWWNEINWTHIPDEDVIPWTREMSTVLDRHDPYKRLRTTSGHEPYSKVWAMPEIDFAQQHDYTATDLNLHFAAKYKAFREDVPTKPLLVGELGHQTAYDIGAKRPFNWDAVHLHNGLWAPIFRGYAGTAMYWWWDLMVDPLKVWPAYKGIARFIEAVQAKTRLAAHKPAAAEFIGGEAGALALASNTHVLVWVRSDLHDVATLQQLLSQSSASAQAAKKWAPVWPVIKNTLVRVKGLSVDSGTAAVRWMDTHTGEWLPQAATRARVTDGVLTLECPDFERDVAAIVTLPGARGL